MKVRHKQTGIEVSGVAEYDDVYICPVIHASLPKHEWQQIEPPIHADRWEDVTGECNVVEGVSGAEYINHGTKQFGVVNYAPTYRLRKVQIDEHRTITGPNGIPQHFGELRWAFLVERKVAS